MLCMVIRGLVQDLEDLEIRGHMETIQTTALLRSARILESWRLEETCCHWDSSGKSSANADVKHSQINKMIITVNNQLSIY